MEKLEKVNILVVDDKPENIIALEALLEECNVNVITALSGNEALEILLNHNFALILMDVQMPVMDGFETAELIRGMEKTREIPLIFITAINKDQKHIFQGYESGAVDYLFKPIDPFILQGKVRIFTDLYQQKQLIKQLASTANFANKAKSEFLANMSHEIKTPLNGIIGMCEMLLRSGMSQEQTEYASIIESSADTLLYLLNDILDYSKIEAGKLIFEEIDFSIQEMIGEASKLMAVKAHEKHLAFHVILKKDIVSHLLGDAFRIRQILLNLLSNAIKFTETGYICLKVEKTDENDSHITVLFSVSDTGIGIPDKQIKDIYMPFVQANTTITRKYGGTGLGLSICKQLIKMMNGEFIITSEEGEGSTFSFEIPFKKVENSPLIHIQKNNILNNIKVLLISNSDCHKESLEEPMHAWNMNIVGPYRIDELSTAKIDWNSLDVAIIEQENFSKVTHILKNKGYNIPLLICAPIGLSNMNDHYQEQNLNIYKLNSPATSSTIYSAISILIGAKNNLEKINEPNMKIKNSLKDIRILVAEDNTINQRVIESLLKQTNCTFDIVDNGLDVLKILLEKEYDIILMDIHMPKMSGIQATKAIRNSKHNTYNNIPIIALTATDAYGDFQKFINYGMSDCVTKPFRASILISTIQDLINKRKQSITDNITYTNKNLKVFNKKDFMERIGNDNDIAISLFSIFETTFEEYLNNLKYAFNEKNITKIKNVTHMIKGATGNIGAERLSQIAENLQKSVDNKGEHIIQNMIKHLFIEYKAFLDNEDVKSILIQNK